MCDGLEAIVFRFGEFKRSVNLVIRFEFVFKVFKKCVMVLRSVLVIQRNWNNFTPFFIPTAFVVRGEIHRLKIKT